MVTSAKLAWYGWLSWLEGTSLLVAVTQLVVVAALSHAVWHLLTHSVCSLQRLTRHRWRSLAWWRHLLLMTTHHCCHGSAIASWRHASSGAWTPAVGSDDVTWYRHHRHYSVYDWLHRLDCYRLIQVTDEWAVLSRQWHRLCKQQNTG